MSDKGFSISNLPPSDGKEKARLTISLNHNTEKIRVWDDTDSFVEFDFRDVGYVISAIKDPSVPRDKKYWEQKVIK